MTDAQLYEYQIRSIIRDDRAGSRQTCHLTSIHKYKVARVCKQWLTG